MTVAGEASIRRWFDDHGWQLEPASLRAALEERGADLDTIVELVDEAADRQRDTTTPQAAAEALLVAPAEYTVGALLLAGATGPDVATITLEKIRATGLQAHMFPRIRDRLIFAAVEQVVDRGDSPVFLTVEAELNRAGQLENAGGAGYIRAVANLVPAVGNAATFARRVVDEYRRSEQARLGMQLAEAAQNGGLKDDLRDQLIQILEQPVELSEAPEAIGGGAFILDEPTDPDGIRVWGSDAAIAWAAGEGLMLVGPDGVGKTTLGQQVALARAGLRAEALGMRVTPDERRVLYIAADRPRQAARSLRRMVLDSERDQLDQAITVWRGPLPQMLNEDRTILTRLAKQFDAGTVVVDSLKDVAVDLATDETGGRVASAFQHLIASGVELLVMHHPRKPGVSDHRKPRELGDVYGSRLIFGVFGSVIMLWGEPGDVLVELRHLKQPIDEVGPWNIVHDHQHGKTTVEHGTDLIDIVLRAGSRGLTASEAAGLVYRKEAPSRAEAHRIRGRLDRLANAEKVVKLPVVNPGAGEEKHRYVFNGPAEALQ